MRCAAVFEEENALPRSELYFCVHNRQGLAGARKDHADVRWHVVAAFRIVREVIGIFRHEAVEKLFQIALRGGIGIFHDDDAATGVLNKNRDCSVSHSAVVDLRLHLIGDFVETLAVAAHFELVVMHMHSRSRYFSVAIRAKQGAAVSSPPLLTSVVWRPPLLEVHVDLCAA
jgi:hypothetical protein